MLIVILGGILAIGLFLISGCLFMEWIGATVILVMVLLFTFLYSLALSSAVCSEPELVREIELVPLNTSVPSDGEGTPFYVNVTAENVYSYRIEVPDETGEDGKTYKLETVFENAMIVETDTNRAVLKVYNIKPKRGLWSLPLSIFDVTYYVAEVPCGGIFRETALN